MLKDPFLLNSIPGFAIVEVCPAPPDIAPECLGIVVNPVTLMSMLTSHSNIRIFIAAHYVGDGASSPVIAPSTGAQVQKRFVSPYASSTLVTLGQNFFSLKNGKGYAAVSLL